MPVPVRELCVCHCATGLPKMTEAQAIAGCVSGDPEAFELLYNMHKRRVYSLCLRMVHDPAEAEDLSQEAFMQLFRKIGTFRGDSAFSTWMHRLTVNIILMRIRKKGLNQVSLDQDRDDGQESPPKGIWIRGYRSTGSGGPDHPRKGDRSPPQRVPDDLCPARYRGI